MEWHNSHKHHECLFHKKYAPCNFKSSHYPNSRTWSLGKLSRKGIVTEYVRSLAWCKKPPDLCQKVSETEMKEY
jgi:hypothetical protein